MTISILLLLQCNAIFRIIYQEEAIWPQLRSLKLNLSINIYTVLLNGFILIGIIFIDLLVSSINSGTRQESFFFL